jgi:hypothetical protein
MSQDSEDPIMWSRQVPRRDPGLRPGARPVVGSPTRTADRCLRRMEMRRVRRAVAQVYNDEV